MTPDFFCDIKPLVYLSLVFYSILEVFIEYFYHSNDLFRDSVFLHDCLRAWIESNAFLKIYEVQGSVLLVMRYPAQ